MKLQKNCCFSLVVIKLVSTLVSVIRCDVIKLGRCYAEYKLRVEAGRGEAVKR